MTKDIVMKKLAVVIPARNEETNLPALIERITASLSKKDIDFEIITIVDKSTDNTLEVAKNLEKQYQLRVYEKEGTPGKGYSLIEGFEKSDAEYFAFIDADLQYPPEKLTEMLELAEKNNHGVVVAARNSYHGSRIRSIGSQLSRKIVGKLLMGLNTDTQSGLKIFRSDIFAHIDRAAIGAWSFDITLLVTAKELGYTLGEIKIDFKVRDEGESKVSFIKTAYNIIKDALKLKIKEKKIYYHNNSQIEPTNHIGKSLSYRGKKYTTHTNLHHDLTTIVTFKKTQKIFIALLLLFILLSFVTSPLKTGVSIIAILSAIYFADVLFTLYLTLKSLHFPPEIAFTKEEVDSVNDKNLPTYTILCPLYKESEVIGQFVENISKLDWPKNKLDVILLLEEDDVKTIETAEKLKLPKYVRTKIVPHSYPKTKPKACNYGLHNAKGDYLVIYDAEDKPDTDQLKKAYLAYQKLDDHIVCIQAKLNYYNTEQNLLTKLFTAEYSLWFDVILPGLQSIDTIIPLGGTSNHFKTKRLVELGGWDPFNVTEDCDLGVRIFKKGYKTSIIDSTTYEEANSQLNNWIRQRSRWIKGYFQTYLVHMRDPIKFVKEHRGHSLIFQLIIGLRISFILINPILWLTTISYFVFYNYVGTTIEALYPSIVFYMAVFSLIFGNFLYLYNYMIGLAKKEKWGTIKFVFIVPFYWILMSVAAVKAFYQLIVKPYYWEKTHHGLDKAASQSTPKQIIERPSWNWAFNTKATYNKYADTLAEYVPAFKSQTVKNGGILILSTFVANLANFIYNAYLGREVNLSQFGTVSLISNIFTIAAVFSNSLGKTTAYKTAYVFGKLKNINKDFYLYIRRYTWLFSLATTSIWLFAIPFMADFFNESDYAPFFLFTPYWMITFVGSVNSGFLSGAHKFNILGLSILVESFSKVILAIIAVETGYANLVYAVIPASIFLTFLFESYTVSRIKSEFTKEDPDISFPGGFYISSIFTKISSVVFLSADVILAKHYLAPETAGLYALLSLAGKMVYFLGNLFGQFVIPIISKEEGKKAQTAAVFYKLLAGSSLFAFFGFLGIGMFGFYTVPILFGKNAVATVTYLPLYALSMLIFSIATTVVSYHQVKKHYVFAVIPLIFAAFEVGLISISHHTIASFVNIIAGLALLQLITLSLMHFFYPQLTRLVKDLISESDEFEPIPSKKRILIFNWRDTRHVWSGGAEVYVHEIAKRWVEQGHKVAVFCGNDRKNPKNEIIDGVKIIRRGGFFTVYFWAVIYYAVKLKKYYDVVVDSENGIPFFSPLFVKKPVILLVHHVHKDVILNEVKLPKYLLPFAYIAKQLETLLMPTIYRNSKIVAVSDSTKGDLYKLGFKGEIDVVNPGIEKNKFKKAKKSELPTILYLGRIKYYKSLDTLIKAFEKVLIHIPSAKLILAGFGEAQKQLEIMTKHMGLMEKVNFLGRVSEEQKVTLLSKSWVFVYPSTMEGWGITAVEASASGTAVIASDVPGLRDSVKNPTTGLLVEKCNIDEFAKAIVGVLKDDKLRKSFENEGIKWAENHTWDSSAQRFMNVITRNSEKDLNYNYSLVLKGR